MPGCLCWCCITSGITYGIFLDNVIQKQNYNLKYSVCFNHICISSHVQHCKQAIQTDTSNGLRPDDHLIPGITNLGQGLNGGQGI